MAAFAGNLLVTAGCAMILAAGGLAFYNVRQSENAGEAAASAAAELSGIIEEKIQSRHVQSVPVYTPVFSVKYDDESEKSAVEAYEPRISTGSSEFTGILTVPGLGLELPVGAEFSMEALKRWPCRYSGSAGEGSLIIAAHNYDSHFGRIKNLRQGDTAYFTDADGVQTVYEVSETEVIPGDAADDMKAGQWDMTLFTCNLSGQSRVTVRFIKKR